MKYKIQLIIIILFAALLALNAQDSLYLYTVFHGENDQDQFGVVENVGDVNGDGYEDLIVGVPAYITGALSSGYAKLYFGGADFDTVADMTFRNYENKKGFGYTIAGNGDLNGDGYSDFAIANPYSGNFQTGKVYVYFGGSQLDTTPDLALTLNPNEYFYTQFGYSMAMNGDINGDGFDDLVIGAPSDDWDRHGEVFIYYGGEDMDDNYDVNLICPMPLQSFGIYLDFIDDVNRDYVDDLLINSTPLESDTTTYIFFGDKDRAVNFSNVYIFPEPISGTVFKLGDIDGNGENDFAVGAKVFLPPMESGGFTELIIHNGDSVSFGIKSSIPDFNGDKYDELVCKSSIGNDERVLIVFGGSEVSIENALVLEDPDEKVGFGNHITSFSNLLGENIKTLIIGDKESTTYTEHGNGKVFIYNNDLINSISIKSNAADQNEFNITQNYPNPFNPTTVINYQLPENGFVTLKVYDVLGREVTTLVNREMSAGKYRVELDASKLSTGVYFYQLKTGNFLEIKKMLLLR